MPSYFDRPVQNDRTRWQDRENSGNNRLHPADEPPSWGTSILLGALFTYLIASLIWG